MLTLSASRAPHATPARLLLDSEFRPECSRQRTRVRLKGFSLVACDTETGPSEGVTLYEHPNFGGGARTFDGSFSDLDFIEGPCGSVDFADEGDWENCASSVRVSPGWEATLYEGNDANAHSAAGILKSVGLLFTLGLLQ